jgi:hypothetical protein
MNLAVDIGAATMRVAFGREPVAVEVLPVAAGPLPWLGLDAGQYTAAGWDQPGSPADALAGLLSLVLDKAPGISSVTLAAPDPWWEGGAAREGALAVVRGLRADLPVYFVPRTVAAAAWFAATEGWSGTGLAAGFPGGRRLLVCDVGAQAVSAAVLAAGSGPLTALGRRTSGSPGQQAAGASFERALFGPAGLGPAAVQQVLRDGRRRAAALLPRARDDARYAGAPVYELPGPPPADILARDVGGAFGPVAQTLRAVLGHPAIRSPLSASALDAVLLTGGLGGIPETMWTVHEALRAGGLPAPAPPARLSDLTAVARGALLLRTGAVSLATPVSSAHLLAHRVRAGRLRSESLLLAADGDEAARAGGPVQVEVQAVDLGALVEARGPAGTAWYAPAGNLPPAGRYEVGFWPTLSGGVLAFRPSAGEPVLVPLTARSDTVPGRARTSR